MKVNQKVSYNNRTYTIVSIEEYDGSLNISQSGYDIQNCKASDAIALNEVFGNVDKPIAIDIPKTQITEVEEEEEDDHDDDEHDEEEEFEEEPKVKRRKKKTQENL